MSEPGGENLRSRLDSILARITGETGTGRFRPDWLLLDLVWGGWLAYAFAVFRGHEGMAPPRFALAFGLVVAPVWWLCGGHDPALGWRRRVGRVGALLTVFAVHAWCTGGWTTVNVTWAAALWLALAAGLTGGGLRLVLARFHPQPGRPALGEVLRWLALLGAAAWLVHPFYTHRPIGAGDAYWYSLMLSDFVEQVRAGQFPVWAGVTEYAFNGAVSPLRLAPWFQHAGAGLDLLTGRSLDHMALKNALIALNMAVLAFSTYFFARAILPRRPFLACLATLAVLASPAVLAPLYVGDQYMTFLALPFLPAVGYGLWRVLVRQDLAAYALLAVGLAGLWLAHPPIALWTSVTAAGAYLVQLVLDFRRQSFRGLVLAVALFLLLGTYPFASAFALDNVNQMEVNGAVAAEEIGLAFPAIFLPLSPALDQSSDYQAGYAVLFLLAIVLFRLPFHRPRPVLVLGGATLLLPCLFLPIPGFTHFFWTHLPPVILQATNTWPLQRFVPIWSFLVLFAFAALQAGETKPAARWPRFLGALCLAGLLGWSGQQAGRLIAKCRTTVDHGPRSSMYQARHNLQLSRYCFVSFASVPSYFSHGYMDPALTHRLLRQDLSLLADNAESAARKGSLPAPDPDGTALLAHGTWRAVNDNHSDSYNLAPQLTLPARQHLALWMEVLEPGQTGWLQILGQDVFREYQLPDSGAGVIRRTAPRSFGTLPGRAQVISLFTREDPETPRITAIAPQHTPAQADYDYARYELWRYDPATLPVAVLSWIPYHVIVHSPEPAWLETPRMWLGGYRAKVNGVRVAGERSPDNLAMFAVPAGRSDITIKFIPAIHLELIFWSCLAGWCGVAFAGMVAFAYGRPADDPA